MIPESVTIDCESGNEFDGRIGLRISAIFVILIGSSFGALFPVFIRKRRGSKFPEWPFFVAKYFGSGVIIATAFIHLLAPANEALGSPCLAEAREVIGAYPWPEAIALMTIFVLFFVELMAMRYATFDSFVDSEAEQEELKDVSASTSRRLSSNVRGEDHLGHSRDHEDDESGATATPNTHLEDYAAQLTALFILEFGVIFHSVFIGLTLAVAGEEFVTLYIVLVFHQTFEGLGLGSRLAVTPWPKSKRWTPYMLGLGYGLSTPIAIAIGLGVRETYAPGSETALITNGVFDSISAGILLYTALVELMAHEFMFSDGMRKAPIGVLLSAFGLTTLGAGLMSVLGYWA